MPETSTMMRAWRTDPVEGPMPGPGVRARTEGEGRSEGADAAGFRRLGAAVVWAGRAAWSLASGRSPARFEEALHAFAGELSATRDAEAIEAALLRIARWIAPAGRVERLRTAGGRPGCDEGLVGPEVEDGSERLEFEEFPVRCGAADHGVLRLGLPRGTVGDAARREIRRRLSMSCTLAASALESARLESEWAWDGAEVRHGEDLEGDDESGRRSPHQRPDMVRDATFLNAVLPFALNQSRRHGEPVSLVCVKLDRLAAIRDLLGTALADQLVHELGEIVGSIVRTSDIVARLEDDRIVALLVRSRSEGALKVARTIGRAVAEAGLGSPRLPGISVSIGVAEFPMIAGDAGSLLDAADEAMARSRADGSHRPFLAQPRPAAGGTYVHAHSAAATARVPEAAACGV